MRSNTDESPPDRATTASESQRLKDTSPVMSRPDDSTDHRDSRSFTSPGRRHAAPTMHMSPSPNEDAPPAPIPPEGDNDEDDATAAALDTPSFDKRYSVMSPRVG